MNVSESSFYQWLKSRILIIISLLTNPDPNNSTIYSISLLRYLILVPLITTLGQMSSIPAKSRLSQLTDMKTLTFDYVSCSYINGLKHAISKSEVTLASLNLMSSPSVNQNPHIYHYLSKAPFFRYSQVYNLIIDFTPLY